MFEKTLDLVERESFSPMQPQPQRSSGKIRLAEKIVNLREQADQLEKLYEELPQELGYSADEALWRMVSNL